MLTNAILDFIIEEMRAQNKSEAQLARYLRKNQSGISRLLKHRRDGTVPPGKKPKVLKLEELEGIFEFLGISFAQDILVAKRKVYVKFAPFKGTIAHGVWRQRDVVSTISMKELPYLPVSEYAHLEQYAYEVVDTHAEKFTGSHTFVLCVSYAKARTSPKKDDIVIIERQNVLSGGKGNVVAIERAMRKFAEVAGNFILQSLSSNPDVDDIPYDPDDLSVKITDLVLSTIQLAPNVTL